MDYQKTYIALIESAKTKNYDIYTEKHHIVPRCLGGNDNKSNLVSLTYREHFLCHWLLCKIHPDNHKLKAAFAKMLGGKKRIVSSWMFDAVKRNIKNTRFLWLEKWSKNNKSPGSWKKGNIPWNKGKKTGPLPLEEKQRRSEVAKKYWSENIHPRKNKSSWNKGRTDLPSPWNKGIEAIKIQCPHCYKIVGGEGNFKRWHGENCKMRVAG